MLLLDDDDLVVCDRQFEHGDFVVFHELCRNRPGSQTGKALMAPSEILLRLHDGDLVRSALGLDRYCVMAAVAVDPEIELVDLDLADALHGRTEMILKAVRRQAEENVDQPIVPNDGE